MLPVQSLVAWEVILTVLHIIAIGSTIFRLIHRFRIKKIGWDDYAAVIAVSFDISVLVQLCFKFHDKFGAPKHLIESFWFSVFLLQVVLWFSRISLLLSVARIFPSGNPVKRNCYLFSLLFLLLGITCMVANTLLCRGNQTLPFYRMRPRCVVTPGGQYPNGIITVSLDVFAESILVVYPLYVLWKAKLSKGPRRLILAAFCASILTLISAVIYLIFSSVGINLGPSSPLLNTAASQIEVIVALMVCNTLVISTYFYRFIQSRRGDGSTSGDDFEVDDVEFEDKEHADLEQDRRQNTPLSSLMTSILSLTSIYSSENGRSTRPTQNSSRGFLHRLSDLRASRSNPSSSSAPKSRAERSDFTNQSSDPGSVSSSCLSTASKNHLR